MLTNPIEDKTRLTIKSLPELENWYDRHYRESGFWQTPDDQIKLHWERIVAENDDIRPEKVLDIGCGDAPWFKWLKDNATCYEYHGIDISEEAIQGAKKRLTDLGARSWYLTYTAAERMLDTMKTLTFRPDEYFDLAVAFGSIEHVVDLEAVLFSIRQSLKPGGLFYLYVPNEKWIHEDQPNERPWPESMWIDMLSVAGFEFMKVWHDGDCSAILVKKI